MDVQVFCALCFACLWSLQASNAVQFCPQPTIKNGFYKATMLPTRGHFRQGSILFYFCHEGYHLKGTPKAQCQKNGHWTGDTPYCIKLCLAPKSDIYKYKTLEKKYYKVGESIKYTCLTGYYSPLDVSYKGATCQPDGTWDRPLYTCYKYCENPDKYLAGDYTPVKPHYVYEDKVYYGCPKSRVKYTYATCGKTGIWILPKFCYDFCKSPLVDHGVHKPVFKSYKYGDKVEFSCDEGYYLHFHGDEYDFAACQKTGLWDQLLPSCKKYCTAPDYGKYYLKSNSQLLYKHGEKITFECDHGYYSPSHIDYDHAICNTNGLWDREPFACYKYCPAQGQFKYGSYHPVFDVYKYGDQLSYSCVDDYYLYFIGETYDHNVCKKDGSWMNEAPECKKYCVAPSSSIYYYQDFEKLLYKFSEKIAYICDHGYYSPPGVEYENAICKLDGTFDKDPFTCYKFCTAPDAKHYNYKGYEEVQYKHGEMVKYECAHGFYPPPYVAHDSATCMSGGIWDNEPFVCQKYCHPPKHIQFGRLHPMKPAFKAGEKIFFSCVHGYHLDVNHNFSVCDKSGHWIAKFPKCIKF